MNRRSQVRGRWLVLVEARRDFSAWQPDGVTWAAVNLIGSYNYVLVALSVVIAMFTSYAALDLAGRI